MGDWWTDNWFNVVGVISAIVTILGGYFSLKGWKRKKPTYVIRSNNIFSGLTHTIPDVEVKFAGYGPPLPALTVTKVAFWNAGNETVNKGDIVKTNPLRLLAKPPVVILAVSVLERTTPHNQFDHALKKDRTEASLTFEYLDHNEGALLQVFHTGTGNEDIQIEGTIKGVPRMRGLPVKSPPFSRHRPRWIVIPALVLPWMCMGILLYMILNPPLLPGGADGVNVFLFIPWSLLLVMVSMITGVTGYILYITNPPKPLSKIHWDNS
jgi:hypothetical protein